jgi:CRP-like cAMP-binding protein
VVLLIKYSEEILSYLAIMISYQEDDIMFEKASILLEKGINFNINEPVKQLLDEYCTFINFPKETIILLQGERSSNIYFIIRGLVRGYYIDEKGHDITKCFAFENEFFSTEGLRTNNPSSFNIECLEECKCIQIPYKILSRALGENSDLYKAFNHYALKAMKDLENRTRDLVMKSAEERYRIFVEQFPKVNKRINQKYIASYIGIRESSLSRIKKLKN